MSGVYTAFQRQLDIIAVAEALTEVRRTGEQGKILCPVHADKNPSCYLYPDGGWKCFACGEHGDIIMLTRALRACSFNEAVDWLADTFNVARPERDPIVEARERGKRVVREALSAGLEAAIAAGVPLPLGLDAELARRLGLGCATHLASALAECSTSPLAAGEATAWEGAWTIELHVRGGHAGFGAFLADAPSTPLEDESDLDAFGSDDVFESDEADAPDDEDYEPQIDPDDEPGDEAADPEPAVGPLEYADRIDAGPYPDVVRFTPSAATRGVTFAGLPAARETIARSGAAIVTPDIIEMIELQVAGIRAVITPTRGLADDGVAAALAALAPRIVVVVTPERRRERGFAASCFALTAAGAKVEIAPRTSDGLAAPVPLATYVAAVARTSGADGARLVGAFLEAVKSPSSRALYAANFAAQGLRPA